MLVRVSVAVDSLLYNSLFVDLDMDPNCAHLSGQSSRLQISRSLVNSGWKSWFTFMTWSSNQIIQMITL